MVNAGFVCRRALQRQALRKLLCFHVFFSIETYAETQYYVSIEKRGGNHGISNVSGIRNTRFALKFLTRW